MSQNFDFRTSVPCTVVWLSGLWDMRSVCIDIRLFQNSDFAYQYNFFQHSNFPKIDFLKFNANQTSFEKSF